MKILVNFENWGTRFNRCLLGVMYWIMLNLLVVWFTDIWVYLDMQTELWDCLCLWRKMIKTKWPVSTYYSICRANLCNRSLINTLWAFLITLVYKNKNNRNANTCISLNRSTPSYFNPQLPSGSVHPYHWTSQFPVLGVSDVLFHFYSISNIYSC